MIIQKNIVTLMLSVIFVLLSSFVFAADLNYVNVMAAPYNATGNGTTDDTAAINSAIAVCQTQLNAGKKPVLYFPPAVKYRTTARIDVPAGINVRMEAPIEYDGSVNLVVLLLRGGSNLEHKLAATRKNLGNWSDENSISIMLINIHNSKIRIKEASKSAIGVQFLGDGGGCAYNLVELNNIQNNKIGLDLASKGAEPYGFVNENLFLKGRFWISTDVDTIKDGIARYGIRIHSKDGEYVNNNNNLFIHPCFELHSDGIPVLIEDGTRNEIIGARDEGNSLTFAVTDNASAFNRFNLGYLSGGIIEDRGDYDASIMTSRSHALTDTTSIVFDSGNIKEKACYYNATTLNIPGTHLVTSSTYDDIYKNLANISFSGEYISFSATGIGVYIDTTVSKKFTVQRVVESGYGGRIAVRCYDADGDQITEDGHLVTQNPSMTFTYTTAWGGAYRTNGDSGGSVSFAVDEDVEKIDLLLTSGTVSLRLKSFKVISRKATTAWTGYEEITPGVNLGTQAPTSGTWSKGRVILNDNKSELGSAGSKYIIEGWECIASGSPGTWIQKRSLTGN